jgi:hypothetical protein
MIDIILFICYYLLYKLTSPFMKWIMEKTSDKFKLTPLNIFFVMVGHLYVILFFGASLLDIPIYFLQKFLQKLIFKKANADYAYFKYNKRYGVVGMDSKFSVSYCALDDGKFHIIVGHRGENIQYNLILPKPFYVVSFFQDLERVENGKKPLSNYHKFIMNAYVITSIQNHNLQQVSIKNYQLGTGWCYELNLPFDMLIKISEHYHIG